MFSWFFSERYLCLVRPCIWCCSSFSSVKVQRMERRRNVKVRRTANRWQVRRGETFPPTLLPPLVGGQVYGKKVCWEKQLRREAGRRATTAVHPRGSWEAIFREDTVKTFDGGEEGPKSELCRTSSSEERDEPADSESDPRCIKKCPRAPFAQALLGKTGPEANTDEGTTQLPEEDEGRKSLTTPDLEAECACPRCKP